MFRKVLVGIVRHSRKVLDGILQKGEGAGAKNVQKPQEAFRANVVPSTRIATERLFTGVKYQASKGYFVQHLAKYARKNLASELRRQFDKSPIYRDYRGLASKLSMYAFLGVGFASYNEEQDFTAVCEQIRVLFTTKTLNDQNDLLKNLEDHGLKDYQLGPMIAKGCNAAVYQARYKVYDDSEEENGDTSDSGSSIGSSDLGLFGEEDSDVEVIEDDFKPAGFVIAEQSPLEPEMLDYVCVDTEDICSDVEVISDNEEEHPDEVLFLITCQQESTQTVEETADTRDPGQRSPKQNDRCTTDCDLAIKVMFNYDIESNATALYRGLEKEMLPARADNTSELFAQWQNGHRAKDKNRLPPHPNIVDMYGGFVDDFPALPEGFNVYPDALPQRINPNGSGRNKTLFLVMKRYPYTLREYLQANPDLSVRQSTLLLLQLVKAVVHMSDHGVAHRDLKSDNIFVDVVGECPHLVVSDFGDCLAGHDLCVPYITDEISKGGNAALQAPEIASARPGPNSVLDYNKSDLWTVGTLAYEIFGHNNPFYRSNNGRRLNSTTYTEEELPQLGNHLPKTIQTVIAKMLSKDPEQRPQASQVSTWLHLLLWSPKEWSLTSTSDSRLQPSKLDLIRWILTSTAQVLLENAAIQSTDSMEHNLRALFLSHLDFEELTESVELLYKV